MKVLAFLDLGFMFLILNVILRNCSFKYVVYTHNVDFTITILKTVREWTGVHTQSRTIGIAFMASRRHPLQVPGLKSLF